MKHLIMKHVSLKVISSLNRCTLVQTGGSISPSEDGFVLFAAGEKMLQKCYIGLINSHRTQLNPFSNDSSVKGGWLKMK